MENSTAKCALLVSLFLALFLDLKFNRQRSKGHPSLKPSFAHNHQQL